MTTSRTVLNQQKPPSQQSTPKALRDTEESGVFLATTMASSLVEILSPPRPATWFLQPDQGGRCTPHQTRPPLWRRTSTQRLGRGHKHRPCTDVLRPDSGPGQELNVGGVAVVHHDVEPRLPRRRHRAPAAFSAWVAPAVCKRLTEPHWAGLLDALWFLRRLKKPFKCLKMRLKLTGQKALECLKTP